MGLITEEVEIVLNSTTKWYENKGYKIPRCKDKYNRVRIPKGAKIIVNVKDLTDSSGVEVKCVCNNCKQISIMRWVEYKKIVKLNGETYCNHCAKLLYASEKRRVTALINGTSFEQWCKNNNRQDILKRWDYELNKYKPDEISYSTNIKCWFKCPCGLHKSELKNINSFTHGEEGSIGCKACNSIGQWLINNYSDNALELHWSNKNMINPFEVDHASSKRVWIRCQSCKEEKYVKLCDFTNRGLSCSKCSDGISYGEKFVSSLLEQLKEIYLTQLTKTTFNWCDKYRYDKYLTERNLIIEIHGIQHYEESHRGRSLKEEQENDRLKRCLAFKNGFTEDNYIIIDARYSTIEHIKNAIMSCVLPKKLNFKENDIDWEKCDREASSSKVKEACEIWNNGQTNTLDIANKLNISRSTVIGYLKRGSLNNWCNYNPKESSNVKIICLNNKCSYDSIQTASSIFEINRSCITACCQGRRKYAGKLPNGSLLKWMYYDDYLKLHNNEIAS